MLAPPRLKPQHKMEQESDLELKQSLAKANSMNQKLVERGHEIKRALAEKDAFIQSASPKTLNQIAEMRMLLEMSKHFVASGAFPKAMNAEQCYTIMQAGKEMGMAPMESLQSLYIVNGSISPHGKGMIAMLTGAGYRMQYLNETKEGVTVQVTKGGEKYEHKVHHTDQLLMNSRAMKIAKQNKMRYHGIRQIINFHLPHLFSSVAIWSEDDLNRKASLEESNQDALRKRIEAHIENSRTPDTLEECRASIDDISDNQDLIDKYTHKMDSL